MKVGFLDVEGRTTRVLTAGGSGPAVLLVHGGGVTADIFVHNLDPLGAHCRAVAPDLPGCGFSAPPADDPRDVLDVCVAHVLGVADALGMTEVCIVGSSLGAQIALLAALARPGRVRALVLTPSATAFAGEAGLRAALDDVRVPPGPRADRDLGGVAAELARLAPAGASRLQAVLLSQATSEAAPGSARGAAWLMDGLRDPDQRRRAVLACRLPAVACPVLVVWGARDTRVPLAGAQDRIALLPGHRLVVFRRSGHLPFLEEPGRFHRLLLPFLGVQREDAAS